MHAHDRPADDVELLVERYLDERAAGGRLALDELALTLREPAQRRRFRATALAQEYLMRVAEAGASGAVELEGFQARLGGEDEQRVFDEVLGDARRARESLPDELIPGACLDGRYEILRELGRGGMGIVYAAFDRELEREVAVKVLRFAGLDAESGWEDLLRRESTTLARLASPSIVAIHDARRGAEHSYIVMDLVRGRDLSQVLEHLRSERASARDPEPLRRAVGRAGGARSDLLRERTHARCSARIVREIAFTLEHAHGVGVVHRDLKPQNVVLLPGGQPVLLDFGLASFGQERSEDGFRGTPEYMAPEQIESERAGTDPRTDVYQLGLVLYEMLASRAAFARREGEELWGLFERIRNGENEPLARAARHAPNALVAVALKAMARDPAQRYQAMADLRADLDRCLAGLPPRLARLARLERLAMHASHLARRPLTGIVAVLLLAVALWLRAEPWVPPSFGVVTVENERLTRIEEGQVIELEGPGLLGLDVLVESPVWLYVFQLFGPTDASEALFVRPVLPMRPSEYASLDSARPPEGVRVDAGEHRLVCSELGEPAAYEGLLVFSFATEQPVLSEWQQSLHDLETSEGLCVPYPQAMRHLELLQESVRGEPLGTLSREARARLVQGVLAAEETGAELGEDWRRYRALHRVEQRSNARGER